MSAAAIELQHVSRWYGNVVAVNDISFTLGPGITGLLGANGAGKSTVLHMVAGLLRPSAGAVLVHGSPAWHRPDLYRLLALVPERESVHPFLTGRDFVLASARLYGVPDPHAAADAAIGHVDLTAAAGRRIETYSKGMRQRIKIAGALVGDPQVLLLDEPFNGMDPQQRLHMSELLQRLAAQGRTVLFSSHILEELETLASSVLVLVAGRLAASGDPREIRRLMTQRPHTLRIRTADDRTMAAALMRDAAVISVELADSGILVRTADHGQFCRIAPRVARDSGIRLYELEALDESLESVFSYLLRA